MELLFSYGTLQKSETQLELFGRHLRGWTDVLEGFTTAEIEIDDEEFLAKGEGSKQLTAVAYSGGVINGMVFEITPEEIAMIDEYEPHNYERIVVTLRSGKRAWLYLAA